MMKRIYLPLLTTLIAFSIVGCNNSIIESAYTDVNVIENASTNKNIDVIEEVSADKNTDVTEIKQINSEDESMTAVEETLEDPVMEIGIELNTDDVKKDYKINDELDLSGLKISLVYSDNKKEEILTEDCVISGIDMSSYGTKDVNVSYKEFSQSFSIEVYYDVTDIEDKTMYSKTSLNVRKGPGTNFDKVGTLSLNEAVKCVGQCENGWYKIEFNGSDAYVSGKYLSDTKIEVPEVNTDTTGLVFDGDVSSACRNKALELYSYVPSNVKQAIVNKGYQVIVSTNSAWTDGHAGTYYPTGYSGWQGRAIAIYAGSVGKVNMAVIHEIGHFIDDYCGNRDGHGFNSFGFRSSSTSGEFQEIYRSEVGASGFPSWATDCYEDYFAEVYWKALVNPSWCQRTIPRSYEFVMRQANSI